MQRVGTWLPWSCDAPTIPPPRWDTGLISYSTEARRYFDPVAARHDLSCTCVDEYQVLYESAHAFLSVGFDNGRSYELSVRCGLKSSPIGAVSLSEIMTVEQSSDAASIDGLMASTTTALASCLSDLARLTTRYAPIAFSASEEWFKQLSKLRREEGRHYAVKRDLTTARREADAAWKRKDFPNVVAVLGPVRFYLSASERKKLEYAIGKCTPF